MIKPFREPFPKDTKPMKFNMDLAHQELLHKVLTAAVLAGVYKEPVAKFMSLKQAKIMLSSDMHEDEYERNREIQNNIRPKIRSFTELIYRYSLHFDDEFGNFVYPKPMMDTEYKYPNGFNVLRDELDEELDCWEEEIRKVMKRMGLFMIKGEDALDAVDG